MKKVRFIPVPEFLTQEVDHHCYTAPAEGAKDASGVYVKLEDVEAKIDEWFYEFVTRRYPEMNEHYRLEHFKKAIGIDPVEKEWKPAPGNCTYRGQEVYNLWEDPSSPGWYVVIHESVDRRYDVTAPVEARELEKKKELVL